MQIFTILKKNKILIYFRYISKNENNQKLLDSRNRDIPKKENPKSRAN